MLKIIIAKEELAKVEADFARTVRDQPHETCDTAIRFRGGPFHGQVLWVPSFGIWAHFGIPPSQKLNQNRFWNVFGLGRPGKSVRITCEINSPFQGVNNSIGGAFATDGTGHWLVLHRGNFRLPGRFTGEFWQHYRGATAQVHAGTKVCTMALVMTLGSPYAVSDLAKFIREVDRVKAALR